MPPAFIIDGHLEKLVVQRLCRDAPVRTRNLNGRDVKVAAIAKSIATFLRLFRDRYYPVIVVIDREDRSDSSLQIENQISSLLASDGHNLQNIIIVCADRMIENWIIAGSSIYDCKRLEFSNIQSEGGNGKSIFRSVLDEVGVSYSESSIGVEMFCTMSFEDAVIKSASFRRLATQCAPFCRQLR